MKKNEKSIELLYFWINRSPNNYIQQKGFSFSSIHKFNLNMTSELYILEYKNEAYAVTNLLKRDNILNFNVVVGENGSGKTTLMRCLTNTNCFPKSSSNTPDYVQMYEDEYENNKSIFIYKIDDEIRIYHNLPDDKFVNSTPYNVGSLFDEYFALESDQKQTIVYLTNSMYTAGFDGFSSQGPLDVINLTPNSIRTLAKGFYNKIIRHPTGLMIRATPFNNLQNLIIKRKNEQDFQQIIDVLYYNLLSNTGRIKTYFAKICKDFEVGFIPIINLINREYPYLLDNKKSKQESEEVERMKQKYTAFFEWFKTLEKSISKKLENVLYLNLIFELFYCFNFDLKKHNENNSLKSIVEDLFQHVTDQKEYFIDALNEIEQINMLLLSCEMVYNNIPDTDMAYRNRKTVSFKNESNYLSFCSFIHDSANKTSFVLKYITIDNLHMSSGERAIQNFFSWLNVLPYFNTIIEQNEIVKLRKNVLLLIDEVDLYMHPEWQRILINELIKYTNYQFKNNNVQIILSTHSPMVLSDIPKQNIIYLEPLNNAFRISDPENHKETFAANIYTLLNDTFYLKKSTIGEFASKIILQIFNELKSIKYGYDGCERFLLKKDYYDEIINVIGEPIIREKLLRLFYECFPQQKDADIIKCKKSMDDLRNKIKKSPLLDEDIIDSLRKQLKDTLRYLNSVSKSGGDKID